MWDTGGVMMVGPPSPARVRLARSIALLADFFQIFAFPLFVAGGLSPLSDVLDIGMALVMTLRLGWHWAFVPTMVSELIPILDLFPTWTVAVFYVTRGGARDPEPEPARSPRLKDITPRPEGAGAERVGADTDGASPRAKAPTGPDSE